MSFASHPAITNPAVFPSGGDQFGTNFAAVWDGCNGCFGNAALFPILSQFKACSFGAYAPEQVLETVGFLTTSSTMLEGSAEAETTPEAVSTVATAVEQSREPGSMQRTTTPTKKQNLGQVISSVVSKIQHEPSQAQAEPANVGAETSQQPINTSLAPISQASQPAATSCSRDNNHLAKLQLKVHNWDPDFDSWQLDYGRSEVLDDDSCIINEYAGTNGLHCRQQHFNSVSYHDSAASGATAAGCCRVQHYYPQSCITVCNWISDFDSRFLYHDW